METKEMYRLGMISKKAYIDLLEIENDHLQSVVQRDDEQYNALNEAYDSQHAALLKAHDDINDLVARMKKQTDGSNKRIYELRVEAGEANLLVKIAAEFRLLKTNAEKAAWLTRKISSFGLPMTEDEVIDLLTRIWPTKQIMPIVNKIDPKVLCVQATLTKLAE